MNPSERIDQLIAELPDWRAQMFASIRKSILEADREIIEEWKCLGSPVWPHDGITQFILTERAPKKLVRAAVSGPLGLSGFNMGPAAGNQGQV